MPSENPWDPFWMERTGGPGGLWYRPNELAYHKKSDNILNQSFISDRWDPRPDLQNRVEDQRGLTLPELDLQAKFQRSRELGPWAPGAATPFDPAAPSSEIAKGLGVNDVEPAARRIAAEAALRRAGEILSMHVPNTGRPDLPGRPKVKKKEVK